MREEYREFYCKYSKNAKIHMDTTISGDYKTCNKAAKILNRMNIEMQENRELSLAIIDAILAKKPYAPGEVLWGLEVALPMQYRANEMIALTKDIAQRNELEFFRLSAEMSLKYKHIETH